MQSPDWYLISDSAAIDTPALCIYPERIRENIRRMLALVPADRLRPHVKTHKIVEVTRLQLDAGISRFKCATIAEAEMLGISGAPDVLIAYPLTGTAPGRLLDLVHRFPATHFSSVVDAAAPARALAACFATAPLIADVYIDLNVGMNRTGVLPGLAAGLATELESVPALRLCGLHAYDGHIHARDLTERRKDYEQAFEGVPAIRRELEKSCGRPMKLVAGGSPTFTFHAAEDDRECSPGTFIFWDEGYRQGLPEQDFLVAAVLLCRVISIPAAGKICVDLGYKSVAAEKPQPRVFFLNDPDLVPAEQSEEHLVLTVPNNRKYQVGDVFYGVPRHVCPSVALYDEARVIENGRWTGSWEVTARKRRISV